MGVNVTCTSMILVVGLGDIWEGGGGDDRGMDGDLGRWAVE